MCLLLASADHAAAVLQQHKTFRKDYKRPEYTIEDITLNVVLNVDETLVKSQMTVAAAHTNAGDLLLHGEAIELISVAVGDKVLTKDQYTIGTAEFPECLVIPKALLPSQSFSVAIENKCFPKKNTELSGLYVSGDLLCTQCEAEGFRRFTYFIDRPDVMARYTVRIEGSKTLYPVILCNGDAVKTEEVDADTHAFTFVDPFKKPSYLFAIVAGPLESIHDTHTTMATKTEPSRKVDLYVYAQKKYMPQVEWAMESCKRAMKWDEEEYGRVYDLSTFRICCIEDFNAGAMENKSLTTFNVSCVLAHRDSSTDARFERVLGVIGHEYFHNWSGDRVTVRDWFQITLKEGFTNFRDQSFSQDIFSSAVKRIEDVQTLRAFQFKEDSGPMSHPIRPESYVAIDNFYTATVYEKGAEVIRMYKTLVGNEGFRKGTDLYFERYDGQAISCDEFRGAIAEANKIDLSQFERWYTQKGTPVLEVVSRHWNEQTKSYELTLRQNVPADALPGSTPGAYHMPIAIGLIGKTSKADLVGTKVLELKDFEQKFVIPDVTEDCVPSIPRDLSAPVMVKSFLSDDELAFLMSYDTNPFNIWDAGQTVFKTFLLDRAQKIVDGKFDIEKPDALPPHLLTGIREALKNRTNDRAFVALCLSLPTVASLETEMVPYAEPVALYRAARSTREQIVKACREEFTQHFQKLLVESMSTPWAITKDDTARRSLQNTLLSYLCTVPRAEQELVAQSAVDYMEQANCFNDIASAAAVLINLTSSHREKAIAKFYEICKDDSTMLDGWFTMQAMSTVDSTLEDIEKLAKHPDYLDTTNPNRFRAFIGAFTRNVRWFHDPSGKGYEFAARHLVNFDKTNAYTTAALTKQLINMNRYSPERQAQMKKQLEWMRTQPLSKNTLEVVSRGLEA